MSSSCDLPVNGVAIANSIERSTGKDKSSQAGRLRRPYPLSQSANTSRSLADTMSRMPEPI
jgi:hypothetical protein